MTPPPVGPANDQQWVDLLERAWSSLGALAMTISDAEWDLPTDVPGWSVRDNLTHITGIEW
ncbi:MAG: maleylpyruvate isomerase N-terminal domain-containing protein, partial [Deltaproteobacteria bacterium]